MRYTTRIIVPPRVRRSGMPGAPGAGPRPQPLGVRKSCGFGDRLGVASPGHLAVAAMHPDFAPVFAQQSPSEMAAAGRLPQDVLGTAARAVGNARYRLPWGADADRLRTPQEVEASAAAGFTYFTIDPAEFVRADADGFSPDDLAAEVERMVASGELPDDWAGPYLDRTIDLPGGRQLQMTLPRLQRAAVKFSRAVQHCARLSETVARCNRGNPYEIEVCVDVIASPIDATEHLFLGLELEARGVRLTSLALRLDEPPEDSVAPFEAALREHAAVAEFCGPYKLSFRADGDCPWVYPVLGRCCADALHVKTSAASWLEALRIVWRFAPETFRQIVAFGHSHHEPAHDLPDDATGEGEAFYLDGRAGRRFLDAICEGVLADGRDATGRAFKSSILELLDQQADLYQELLVTHFDRLLQLLKSG